MTALFAIDPVRGGRETEANGCARRILSIACADTYQKASRYTPLSVRHLEVIGPGRDRGWAGFREFCMPETQLPGINCWQLGEQGQRGSCLPILLCRSKLFLRETVKISWLPYIGCLRGLRRTTCPHLPGRIVSTSPRLAFGGASDSRNSWLQCRRSRLCTGLYRR
jgi:hypothetical protein